MKSGEDRVYSLRPGDPITVIVDGFAQYGTVNADGFSWQLSRGAPPTLGGIMHHLDENITWIKGHHAMDSLEVLALKAAALLARS